jgi:hypothetical protein
MSAPRPPSIGDGEKAEYALSRVEVTLPSTRREVIATVERLLNEGGVQKLVVEVGRPIQVTRLVDKSSMLPPEEAPPDDFWNQVRNGRMEEMQLLSNKDGLRHLFHAFQLITARKLRPKVLFIHDWTQLRNWLGVDDMFPVDVVFGIDAMIQKDIPEDAVILTGTSYDETDITNTIGIRIPVELDAVKVVNLKRQR